MWGQPPSAVGRAKLDYLSPFVTLSSFPEWRTLRPILRAVIDARNLNGVFIDPVDRDVRRKH
jgi:hypothetical protein